MNFKLHALAIAVVALVCATLVTARPGDEPSTEPSSQPSAPSHKAKSFKGSSKVKAKQLKFQVGSARWHLSVSTDVDHTGGAVSANIFVQLYNGTQHDAKSQPENWTPLEIIYSGVVPKTIEKDYENGMNKDGSPRWFALVIQGNSAYYEITITDDAGPPPKKSKSKKKSD